MTFSPPALWYSSSFRCSTTSRAGPWRSVHRNDPRESSASLSIVRILLTAHNFHRRYSLQSQSSPEKYRSEAPNSPMALIFRDPCHLTLAQHSPTYQGAVKTPGALLAPLPMLVAGRTPRAAFSLHMGQKSLRHVPPFDLALILHSQNFEKLCSHPYANFRVTDVPGILAPSSASTPAAFIYKTRSRNLAEPELK